MLQEKFVEQLGWSLKANGKASVQYCGVEEKEGGEDEKSEDKKNRTKLN